MPLPSLPLLLLVLSPSSSSSPPSPSSSSYRADPANWEPLTAALQAWERLSFDKKFGVNAGDDKGRLFLYESPGYDHKASQLLGASLSKWPSAVMISGVVQDPANKLSFDDFANKHLAYWSKLEFDPRSQVRLGELLSFTSGLMEDVPAPCLKNEFDECTKELYDLSRGIKEWARPNTTFQYLSGHLQFAAAIATAASGKPIQELFKTYLFDRYNMKSTSYAPEKNPSIAAGITTTGQDFENLLFGLLTAQGLDAPTLKRMETDHTANCNPSGDEWFGHYGYGHWWECLGYGTPNERDPLNRHCLDAHIQAGPGEFGYYPLIDRSGGGGAAGPERPPYYFQIPIQEPDALSGIPEYLRIVAKPVADLIMAGVDPRKASRSDLLANGGGLIARDIPFIQDELGNCTCTGARGERGEPYKSLLRGLPDPDRHSEENRFDILARGEGITIFDIANVQARLGDCYCDGRRGEAEVGKKQSA